MMSCSHQTCVTMIHTSWFCGSNQSIVCSSMSNSSGRGFAELPQHTSLACPLHIQCNLLQLIFTAIHIHLSESTCSAQVNQFGDVLKAVQWQVFLCVKNVNWPTDPECKGFFSSPVRFCEFPQDGEANKGNCNECNCFCSSISQSVQLTQCQCLATTDFLFWDQANCASANKQSLFSLHIWLNCCMMHQNFCSISKTCCNSLCNDCSEKWLQTLQSLMLSDHCSLLLQ